MPYLTLSQLKKQQQKFDFIVVGAGSAGCPLASRLSEDLSVTVLLVEAGASKPATTEESLNGNLPIGAPKMQRSSLDWGFVTEPQYPRACTHYHTYEGADPALKHRNRWPRGKAVGGSSKINYMMYCKGHPNDYKLWETDFGALGWGWDTVGPLMEKTENASECIPQIICPKCHGTDGPLGVSHRKPPNPLANAFVGSAKALGFSPGDYNCFCNTGRKGVVGWHQQTVRQGTRCDVARAYIDPIVNRRPNLFVVTGANCQKVLTQTEKDDKKEVSAIGIQLVSDSNINGDKLDIMCTKEVILSAGSLGSPQILLQSGIGPQGAIIDAPQVGRNLQDHVVALLLFTSKKEKRKEDIGSVTVSKVGATNPFVLLSNLFSLLLCDSGIMCSSTYDASLFYSTVANNKVPDSQLSIICAGVDRDIERKNLGMDTEAFQIPKSEYKPTAQGMHLVCTLLHPKSKGHVELRKDSSKNHGLVIHPNYLSDAEDVKILTQIIRTACQLVSKESSPLGELVNPSPTLPVDLCEKYKVDPTKTDTIPDAFWEEYIRRYTTTLYHPVGTCRIGRDNQQGVVDYQLRVFGVAKLRVADASIQPEVVSGNTNASCVMIGEKAAELIQGQYGLQKDPKQLSDAVEKYEAWIRYKRYAVVVFCILFFSLAIAAIVTVGVFKYHGVDLWVDEDPMGICEDPSATMFPLSPPRGKWKKL